MSCASGIATDTVKTLDFNGFYLTMRSIFFSKTVTTIAFFSKKALILHSLTERMKNTLRVLT